MIRSLPYRVLAFALTCAVASAGVGVSVPTTAWASPGAAKDEREAKRLFELGNRAFDDGRYSDALAAYRRSFELVPRPSTLFNIAICRDLLGEGEGAFVDYQRFTELAAEKDRPLVDKAQTRLGELRESLRRPVQVTSTPAGAAIRVDGTDAVVAYTPSSVPLSLGPHELRLDAPLHRSAVRTVEVVPGVPTSLEATLEAIGALTITTEPADATIAVDGAAPTVHGRLALEVEPGPKKITVRRDGYVTQTLEVPVVGGTTTSRHVELQRVAPPPAATVAAPVNPEGAPRRSDRVIRWSGLALGVVGVLGIAVGIQQGLTAQGRSDDAQDAAGDLVFDADAYSDAQTAERRMYIGYGIGGAALAIGASLFVWKTDF